MSSAAFLVDGHLEQYFIQQVCPDHPVHRINCNGHNVSLNAIAKHVASHCRLFNNRYYPIIVIIDREDRDETSVELCNSLIGLLRQEGVRDLIIVGIADRMVENWILADQIVVKEHPNRRQLAPTHPEGLHGKNEITKCFPQYHETTLGVDLLLKCKPSRIRKNSESFNRLYNQLPKKGCKWLQT